MKTITVILNNEALFDIEYEDEDDVNIDYLIDNLENYISFEDLDVEVEYFDDKRIVLRTTN